VSLKTYGGLTRRDRLMTQFIAVPESGCWLHLGKNVGGGYSKTTWGRAHRVFYEEFIGPIPAGCVVAHKCDVPCCVNPAHLVACSQAENIADKVAKGRQAQGERMHFAKLNDDRVREIRGELAARPKATYTRLGAQYGVHRAVIARIDRGEAWTHVD
jgi:hypothetical protein